MSQADGAISSVIVRVVGAVLRRPLVTVVGVLMLSAAGLGYTLTPGHLTINTDTANMISDSLPWRQDFNAYRDSFPARDGNIVVVIDGDSSALADNYARALLDALRAEPALFASIFPGRASEFFTENGLLYLSLDELDALADRLSSAQPLLATLADDTSGAAVLELLAAALTSDDELPAGTGAALSELIDEVDATLAAAAGGERRPVAWRALLGSDIEASNRHLLLIRPAEVSGRIMARPAIERIRAVRDELSARFGDSVDARLTGTPVMEYEEQSSIIESAVVTGVIALVLVVAVLLWFLRSIRLLLIAVVTLLAGLALTATFAAVTVGELNLLSVAFAVLYVGLGVDFILHIVLRLHELQKSGAVLTGALLETARGVGSSLVICAVTTAVGFLAFTPTDFTGISALGLIAGGGMIISLLVSLSLLPALIVLTTPAAAAAGTAAVRRLPSGLGLGLPPPRVTLAAAAVIGLLAIGFLPPVFDGNPVNLRDPQAESVRTLNALADSSEAPLFSLAVIAPDADAAAALADRLRGLPTVQQVQHLMSFVPAEQPDKLDVIDFLALDFGPMLARIAPAEADPVRLTAAVGQLARLLPDSAAPAWLERIGGLPAPERDAAAVALDRDISSDLVAELGRLEAGLGAASFGADDLPAALRDRWVGAGGQQLVEIVPRDNLNDRAAAARFVAAVQAVAPAATGLPVVYERAAETVTRSFLEALAYAFVAVSLMLLVFLRSVRDAVMVMLPIVFAAVVTAGVSAMIGLELNFANIIALPLLVGIGVDSGIHVVHRMRTEPPADGNPLHTSTSRAVFASALTTIASFGNLAFATHAGMASMGQLLSLGMLMSLVAVLILLPALMRLRQTR